MLEEQRGAHAEVSRCRIGGLGVGKDIALRSSWGVFVWHLAKLRLRNSTVDDCEFVGVRMYVCVFECMCRVGYCEFVGVRMYVCVCMYVHCW